MNFIRKIDKIKDFVASCTLWNLGISKRSEKSALYFMDGLIAINSKESMLIGENQPEFYAFNIGKYEEMRNKYAIKDNDIFLGRDENYLLFRDGKLSLKTNELNIDSTNINITCTTLNINGIAFAFTDGKLSINGKEVAVVGGEISTSTKTITTSGQ